MYYLFQRKLFFLLPWVWKEKVTSNHPCSRVRKGRIILKNDKRLWSHIICMVCPSYSVWELNIFVVANALVCLHCLQNRSGDWGGGWRTASTSSRVCTTGWLRRRYIIRENQQILFFLFAKYLCEDENVLGRKNTKHKLWRNEHFEGVGEGRRGLSGTKLDRTLRNNIFWPQVLH
jgi:hypothetical protein